MTYLETSDTPSSHICQPQDCFNVKDWKKVTDVRETAPYSGFGKERVGHKFVEVLSAHHPGELRSLPKREYNFWWDTRGTTIEYYMPPRLFTGNLIQVNRG